MLEALQDNLVSAFAAGFVAFLSFVIRHYFTLLRKEFNDGAKDIAALAGRIDALAADVRANTVQSAITSTEIKALWRTVDGAYERASDNNDNGGNYP
jgi:hypothetical protein